MGARRTTPGGARQKIGSLSGGVTIRGGALTYRTEQGVEDPSIEPTNNRGERALRPAVIVRKLSHGAKNECGAEAFALQGSAASSKQRPKNQTAPSSTAYRTCSCQATPSSYRSSTATRLNLPRPLIDYIYRRHFMSSLLKTERESDPFGGYTSDSLLRSLSAARSVGLFRRLVARGGKQIRRDWSLANTIA